MKLASAGTTGERAMADAIRRRCMAARQAYRDQRMREQDARLAADLAQKAAGALAER